MDIFKLATFCQLFAIKLFAVSFEQTNIEYSKGAIFQIFNKLIKKNQGYLNLSYLTDSSWLGTVELDNGVRSIISHSFVISNMTCGQAV